MAIFSDVPFAVALPPPAPFPAPAGAGDPLFGVNPFGGPNLYLALQGNTQLILSRRERLAQLQRAAQFAAVDTQLRAQTGVGLDRDPREWTPEEAVAQTDRALAKLATVNPELAQQLAEKRMGQPADGGGFFDSLKHVLGEVLEPGLAAAGKLLDIVSRTSNIVPNLVFDLVDGGEFHPGADIAGALNGTVRHNWNAIFQEMGWQGDGFGGVARALFGFVGDVVTDPVTWLFPAGSLMKVEERMALGARKVATESEGIINLARSVEKFAGMTDEQLVAHLRNVWDAHFTDTFREALKTGKATSDLFERRVAALNGLWAADETELYRVMFETGDRTARLIRTRTFRSASGDLVLSPGRWGSLVTMQDARQLFERAVKAGNWAEWGSKEWAQARAYAQVLGGLRLKVAVPFTTFRYISPAANMGRYAKMLPSLLKHMSPNAVLSEASRAFAGQSGMQNLVHLIHLGEADWSHLTYWMENGWEKFSKEFPDVAAQMRNRFGGVKSMYYQASELIGGITAHLSPHARASRLGLAGYIFGEQAPREAKSARNSFVHNVINRALGTARGKQVMVDLKRVFNDVLDDPDIARFLELFPTANIDTPEALERWFFETFPDYASLKKEAADALRSNTGLSPEVAQTLAELQQRLNTMKRLLDKFTPEQRRSLNEFRSVWDIARDEATKHGALLGDVRYDFEHATGIPFEQVDDWRKGGGVPHPVVLEGSSDGAVPGIYYIHVRDLDADVVQEIRNHGLTDRVLQHGEDGHGVYLHSKPSSSDDIEVVIRGDDFLELDETGDARLPDYGDNSAPTVKEAKAKYRRLVLHQLRAAQAQRMSQDEIFNKVRSAAEDSILTQEEIDRAVAEAMTEEMSHRLPGTKGTYRRNADGSITVTMWDINNVKLVGDEFPAVAQHQGYFHRMLSQKVLEWLRGNIPKHEAQIMLSVPGIAAEIQRKTIGMTFDEANAFVHELLRSKLPHADFSTLPDMLWETDLLKVHDDYLHNLGRDIEGRILMRYADRAVRLGRIAPAMFGSRPRGQEFEWVLDAGFLKALKRVDKNLAEAVMKLAKQGTAFQQRQHRLFATIAQHFGDYALLLEDGLLHLGPPDPELEATLRYGRRAAEAQRIVDGAKQVIREEKSRLLREDDEYRALRERFAEQYAKQQGAPEAAEAAKRRIAEIEEELKALKMPTEAPPPATPAKPKFTAKDADRAKFRTRVDKDGGEWVEVTIDGEVIGELRVTSKAPSAERVHGNVGVHYKKRKAWAAPNGEARWKRREAVEDLIKHYTEKTSAAATPAPAREEALSIPEYISRRMQLEEELKAQRQALKEATPGPLKPLGEGLGGEDPLEDGRRLFDHLVERGEVHVNTNTGEVLTKEGALVRPGGGRKLRPSWQRELDLEDLRSQERVLAHEEERLKKAILGGEESAMGPHMEELDAVLERQSAEGSDALAVARLNETQAARYQKLLDAAQDPNVKTVSGEDLGDGVWKVDKGGKVTYIVVDADNRVMGILESDNAGLGVDLGQTVRGVEGAPRSPEGTLSWGERLLHAYWRDNGINQPYQIIEWAGRQQLSGDGKKLVRRAAQKYSMTIEPTRSEKQARAAINKALKSRGVAAKQHAKAIREVSEAVRKLERARAQMDKAMNQVNKAMAEAKGVKARALPALHRIPTAGNLEGLTRLRVPGLEGYAMPAYIAEEWHRILDENGPEYLTKMWRRFVLGPWKRWATYRWPGFHVRNFFGAWFNNWLGGVTLHDYAFSYKVNNHTWADQVVGAEEFDRYALKYLFGEDMKGKVTYGDIADHLSHQGIGAGNVRVVMEAANTVDQLREALDASSVGAVRSKLQAVDGKMRQIGATVEDFHRAAAWARGMAVTEGDTYGARAFTMMRHGDYADLSPAEDHIRDLVPFYKWLRTNVPFQIRALAESPGQLTAVHDKLKDLAFGVAGYDRRIAEVQQPDWMKQTLALPVPSWVPVFGSKGPDAIKYAMFDLPYSDLYNGLNDYISSVIPLARNVLESYAFHRQAFTGRELSGRMVKLSGLFGETYIGELLSKTPLAKKGADGSYYIDDRIENVLTAWPIFSRFRNFVEADPQRVEARLGGLLSTIAGVNLRESDFVQAELDFFYNEVEPVLQAYRDMGVKFPNARDFVDAGEALVGPGLPDFQLPESGVLLAGKAA